VAVVNAAPSGLEGKGATVHAKPVAPVDQKLTLPDTLIVRVGNS